MADFGNSQFAIREFANSEKRQFSNSRFSNLQLAKLAIRENDSTPLEVGRWRGGVEWISVG